jgi:hypothetical protein
MTAFINAKVENLRAREVYKVRRVVKRSRLQRFISIPTCKYSVAVEVLSRPE